MCILLTTLNAKYIHVNLALRYLRACCRDLPLEFILEEFTINDHPEHVAAAIYRHRPDLVAFSCYIWNLEPGLAVAAILKKVRPDLPILCGGPEVSFGVKNFLSRHPQVDLVITGEGEVSFRALMEQLARADTRTIPVPEGQFTGGPAGLPGQLPGERFHTPSGQPFGGQFHDVSIPPGRAWLHPRSLAAVPGLVWRWEGKIRLNPPALITSPDVSSLVLKDAAEDPSSLPGDAPAQLWALLPTSSNQEAGPPSQRSEPGYNPLPGNPSPFYQNLDAIPFPYEEDLAAGGNDLRQRTVYYETSRGCPFACGFCLSSTTTGLRYFSLERVREDLARLLAAGVREIKFVDRTFNAHKKRALAIWEYLLSLRPEARFYFEIAGDHLDDEMLAFLSQVPPGLFQFEIGVQTIDGEVNARCNRRQDWERLAANIRRLHAGGNIRLHLDLIAGLPGENYAGVGKSFDAVAALKPHEIQLGFLKLLKGTNLRARAGEFGYLFLDRPPYQVLASSTMTYDEMLRLHDIEAVLKYYGNSHLADHALGYLMQTAFNGSPFACYEALAAWWETRGLLRRGHSQRDLFNHLAYFAIHLAAPGNAMRIVLQPLPGYHRHNIHGADSHSNITAGSGAIPFPGLGPGSLRNLTQVQLDRFYQLLKFDFLCHDRSRNFPDWVPPSPWTEEERSNFMKRITDPYFIEKNWPELAQEAPASLRRHGFIELFPCHPEKPEEDNPTLVFFYYGPPGKGDKKLPFAVLLD